MSSRQEEVQFCTSEQTLPRSERRPPPSGQDPLVVFAHYEAVGDELSDRGSGHWSSDSVRRYAIGARRAFTHTYGRSWRRIGGGVCGDDAIRYRPEQAPCGVANQRRHHTCSPVSHTHIHSASIPRFASTGTSSSRPSATSTSSSAGLVLHVDSVKKG